MLIAGGENASGLLSTVEIYNPAMESFAAETSMGNSRASHTATRLLDGRVLIAGGVGLSTRQNNPFRPTEIFTAAPTRPSNVIFLPGAEASRLYRCEKRAEMQLWLPNGGSDLVALTPTSAGISEPGIYTRDIVERPYDITTSPILCRVFSGGCAYTVYREFSSFMNDTFTPAGWEPVAYDWRLHLDQILSNGIVRGSKARCEAGVQDPTERIDLKQLIIDTAQRSPTRKVSVITHSNGGLLAKRLIQVLKAEGRGGLVDRLIMVATPQLGTPKSLATLLHGDELGPPSVYAPPAEARQAARNMPAAYNLIPDREFFSRTALGLITFPDGFRFPFEQQAVEALLYGFDEAPRRLPPAVDDYDELRGFLLATPPDPRTRPSREDLQRPEVLDAFLLSQAEATHQEIDAFASDGVVRVYQIVGVGLDTTRQLAYTQSQSELLHKPHKLPTGDGTVVMASAGAMESAITYFIDLAGFNSQYGTGFEHGSIMEVSAVQQLIRKILVDGISAGENPSIPFVDLSPSGALHGVDTLQISIGSPAELHAFDSARGHTGPFANPIPGSGFVTFDRQIPNSSYSPPGDLWLNTRNGPYRVEIRGTSLGTVRLVVSEFFEGNTIGTIEYPSIPVADGSIISFQLGTLADADSIAFDTDGDGVAEIALSSQAISDPISYSLLVIDVIGATELPRGIQQSLVAKLTSVVKSLRAGNRASAKGALKAYSSEVMALDGKQIQAGTAKALTTFATVLEGLIL